MPGLPLELYGDCRNTFLRCREFESYQALRAVFVTKDLSPFRIGLPSAGSPTGLVDRCLEHLLRSRLKGNRPVLPVFIATLRDRYHPNNALHDDLDDLCQDVQSAMNQSDTQRPRHPHHKQALFESLLKIDFGEQVQLVKQTLQLHRVASFLVHGKPNYGQQMLVNRLLRLVPGWQTGQRISVDLGSNGTGKSIRSLWRQVARKLDVSPGTQTSQLAEQVCEWWRTQDVVFIFHTVDYMPPSYLSRWIEDFWQPLVTAAHSNLHEKRGETHLVMFLIDYSGCVCDWEVALAQKPDAPEYPRIPLRLPPPARFPSEMLSFWINVAAEVLPADLTVQEIMKMSEDGIPQIVYQAICDRCGLSWEGELTKWLV